MPAPYFKNKLYYSDPECTILQNGPVIISPHLTIWFQDGTQHREDGPALIYSYGLTVWYYHGKVHRADGPAVTWPSGNQYWCTHGVLISKVIVKDPLDFIQPS